MAFRLADVKKTVRARSDGERYLHPKILDGVAVTTQVALALSYFHSRLGRARHELDPEALVRFFGDAKVARGLVACLSATYRWRSQELADVLDGPAVARLAARGIATPGDLRLYLFDALNARGGGGFLASPREECLWPLARRLRLTPEKLDQLVALDAAENAVLVRIGPAPEPEQVVASYNFYAVEAVLRHSSYVELSAVPAAHRAAIEAACRRHGVALTWIGDDARLLNQADLFGSFARHGGRLTRALFEGVAAQPRLLCNGRARVPLSGRSAYYLFDRDTVRALSGKTGAIYAGEPWPELREAWGRRRAATGTAGWRLITAPEPTLTTAGLLVAPFAARRGETQVTLWPVRGPEALAQARVLGAAGVSVLPIVRADATVAVEEAMPCASESGGAGELLAALDAQWSDARYPVAALALDGLLGEVAERGFVSENDAAEALGCASPAELAQRLRSLNLAQARYVAGLGLCSPEFAERMRKGLRRRRNRTAA